MNKKVMTFTYIMMCISALLALFMVAMIVVSIFVIQTVPTIIIFATLTCPAVLLTLHYARCIKFIKNMSGINTDKPMKLKNTNSALAVVFGIVAFNTLLVALYPVVFYGGEILQEETSLFFFVYFIATCIFSALFAVNLAFVNKGISKSVDNHCQITTESDMKNTLQHYKYQSKGELANIIDNPVTYAVLRNILHYQCTDIYTNGQSIVICYSNKPYPVWVWCKKPFASQDVWAIADILKNKYLAKGNYRFIISEDLLDELAKIDDMFGNLTERMQLFSYELREICDINYKCDGVLRKATLQDATVLAHIFRDAHMEMEGFDISLQQCKNKAVGLIDNGDLYLWQNDQGEIVATTSKSVDGKYAKIAWVYTLPNQRRKGYAINLVHAVSKMLLEQNLIPILYTNGNYVASNECYKKIGYVQVGKLVEVERK